MEKHLLISKGCKGWGGPLTITLGQGKKIAYITGGIRPPVVDRLSELTGWPPLMYSKMANRRQKRLV